MNMRGGEVRCTKEVINKFLITRLLIKKRVVITYIYYLEL